MYAILAQIQNANSLEDAKSALSEFRGEPLEGQANAILGPAFHPTKCKVDEIKSFYKFYLDGFDFDGLKTLMATTVQTLYSGPVALFAAIEKDEFKEAFTERLCEVTNEEFSEVFSMNVRYTSVVPAMDVAVGVLLLQHAGHSKKLLTDKIKDVGLTLDSSLYYYDCYKTLVEVARDVSAIAYGPLLGFSAEASGGGVADLMGDAAEAAASGGGFAE